MASFEVIGGQKLQGEITPQGAKNEALQVLCAVLLTAQKVTIRNVPDILDVNKLIELLIAIGVEVSSEFEGTFTFCAKAINIDVLQGSAFVQKAATLRGSIMMVGPLLARYGEVYAPRPGGDKIGRRRLDTHFIGFEKLGAQVTCEKDDAIYRVEAKHLQGTYMLLDEASVTGTAN
ncbi:MAG: UDP-N-acetylglucosamine 1-carboxyvinyltransferase, partial [Bacteroidales bacterium]